MILPEFKRQSLATDQWLDLKDYPSQEIAFQIRYFSFALITTGNNSREHNRIREKSISWNVCMYVQEAKG